MKKLLALSTAVAFIGATLLASSDTVAQDESNRDDLATPGPSNQEPVFVEPPPPEAFPPSPDFGAEGGEESAQPPSNGAASPPAAAATPSGRIKIAPPAAAKNGQPAANARASKGTAPAKTPDRESQRIESFDFQNAEIEEVVRAISQLTGRNFILDPQVKGKISVIAPSAVTVGEAYRAFLSALAINGYTVVPSGKFQKIMPARIAQRDSIDIYTNKQVPNSDQMVTRIVSLKNLSVADITRFLRTMNSKDGDMIGYEPTNSLIISDYASNIRRLMKIIDELDQPGFQEKMSVIPIKYARAKDLADLIDRIINKGQGQGGRSAPGTPFRGGNFRGPAAAGAGGSESLSLVAPDERTNSLIVVGNQEGIDKVKTLVEELDFNLDPSEAGGVFVYRLKHSVAETVAQTLTGLASAAGRTGAAAPGGTGQAPSASRPFTPPGAGSIFGGDIKITPDKTTNSLIIVGSKQDYDVVRGLLAKLDIPRDQVYVEAIIMEVNTDKTRDWNIANYYFDPSSNGIGRTGFSGGNLTNLLNPVNDAGLVLGFGRGEQFTITIPGSNLSFQIPTLISFINFLQRHTDANILSTPQILAMDNEEAKIEVGDQIPIGLQQQTTSGGVITNSPQFDKATIKLTITPHISPESNTIRMKIDQSVRQASEASARVGAALRDVTTIISDRSINTNIVVENEDTVVLGGLIRDEETHTITKVPLLGDIPVIGWLFKSDRVQTRKINLMVFLTPKIVRGLPDSRMLLGKKMQDRAKWMSQNFMSEDPYKEKIDSLRRPLIPEQQSTPQDQNRQQITPPNPNDPNLQHGSSAQKPRPESRPAAEANRAPASVPPKKNAISPEPGSEPEPEANPDRPPNVIPGESHAPAAPLNNSAHDSPLDATFGSSGETSSAEEPPIDGPEAGEDREPASEFYEPEPTETELEDLNSSAFPPYQDPSVFLPPPDPSIPPELMQLPPEAPAGATLENAMPGLPPEYPTEPPPGATLPPPTPTPVPEPGSTEPENIQPPGPAPQE